VSEILYNALVVINLKNSNNLSHPAGQPELGFMKELPNGDVIS
jgi:hypothetical protein